MEIWERLFHVLQCRIIRLTPSLCRWVNCMENLTWAPMNGLMVYCQVWWDRLVLVSRDNLNYGLLKSHVRQSLWNLSTSCLQVASSTISFPATSSIDWCAVARSISAIWMCCDKCLSFVNFAQMKSLMKSGWCLMHQLIHCGLNPWTVLWTTIRSWLWLMESASLCLHRYCAEIGYIFPWN